MKKLRLVLVGMALVFTIICILHAQETVTPSDFEVELQALEATTPMPASQLPDMTETHGFYSAKNPDWAPSPADILEVPVWPLGGGMYVMDDLNVNYAALAQESRASDLMTMDSFFSPLTMMTTNDLWLQLNGVTNDGTGWTANLTINTPWNDTNLTHDLLYTTSIDSPIDWRFLMRCTSTNVVVSGLCEEQGFFALTQTNGALTVSTNATAQQLAQLLVPPWVTVTNATYTGAVVARGTFAGGNGCGLPIDTGVILSSGRITNAIGPNNDSGLNAANNGSSDLGQPGDADLSNLVGGGPTSDAAVLEFDIISTNSFTLQFQYIFASEEYPEWIGSPPNDYNDPMAIFVSTNRVGTNWVNSITNDFALVPGTTNVPVSVNTINGGCITDAGGNYDSPVNSQYYVDNHDPYPYSAATNAAPAQEFNIQYDGMTVLLTAQTLISANVTNHVKIAIADYAGIYDSDFDWDSAIFITTGQIPCN
jgi:hypothetical protein